MAHAVALDGVAGSEDAEGLVTSDVLGLELVSAPEVNATAAREDVRRSNSFDLSHSRHVMVDSGPCREDFHEEADGHARGTRVDGVLR